MNDSLNITVLPDGGPLYRETDLTRFLPEPWNGASSLVFVLLSLFWFWRLRGNYKVHLHLTVAITILLIGGIGGTLYHATRASRIFLWLDEVPINLLTAGVALFFWSHILKKWWIALPLVPLIFFIEETLKLIPGIPVQTAISLGYVFLGSAVLIPLVLLLIRTRFAHAAFPFTAIFFYCIALFCRVADGWPEPLIPGIGTHWLWHVFSCTGTGFMLEYVYATFKSRNNNLK